MADHQKQREQGFMTHSGSKSRHIAVVGAGAAGLAAAWLINRSGSKVTLMEAEDRLGGHAHTADVPGLPVGVDTGFIVYNEPNYPNLTAWFEALGVATEDSDMSFAVSRDNGGFEYAGGPLLGLVAQPGLPLKPRFWSMLRDLLRFYRDAPRQIPEDSTQTLGDYLHAGGYSEAFLKDHLLPFGAAVWSTSASNMLDYPAAAFIRFCHNHGLLKISDRPQWRTVSGGSRHYVEAVRNTLSASSVRTGSAVVRIERRTDGVRLIDREGQQLEADEVVIATHADQALGLLASPDENETRLLSPFAYDVNRAVLHSDARCMPRRRRAWCSWNYVEQTGSDPGSKVNVSYWMNRLQNLPTGTEYFVTLNPELEPDPASVVRTSSYTHPIFTARTWQAQQELWHLQGQRQTWFCGSYFGAGFHEDAVQSGLAVAEQLVNVSRPWQVAEPNGRIVVHPPAARPQTAPDHAA